MSTVQFYVDDWISEADIEYGGKADLLAAAPHPTDDMDLHRNELADYLEGSKHILSYVIVTELSKEENGAKGQRWHHQGIIEYDYQKKQNLDTYIKKFVESKGLSGKTKDWGSTVIKKSKEENLKYILKDQKEIESVSSKGYNKEYLIELMGQWKSKEQFKKEKEKRLKGKTYNQMILEKYESERTISLPIQSVREKEHILEDVTNYFYQYYMKDKLSLPQRKIEEGIAAVCLKYEIITQKEFSKKSIHNIKRNYVIIE